MRIERIYVASHRSDLRYTRCCIASIRRWYPEIPISLVKNEISGAYDTEEIERYWDVDCFKTERRKFRGGLGKLEPLFQQGTGCCFILDSDTVFLGRVLDALESLDADFVVNDSGVPENIAAYFFNLTRLRGLDPDFEYRGNAFNSGQFAAATGVLQRIDFGPWLIGGEPQELRYPGIFFAADQGLLNYVVLKKWQQGHVTLAGRSFMWWAGEPSLGIKPDHVANGAYPMILHWAGIKHPLFRRMPQAHVLDHYERLYYSRIPNGRKRRALNLASELGSPVIRHQERRIKRLLLARHRQARSWFQTCKRLPRRFARSVRARLR